VRLILCRLETVSPHSGSVLAAPEPVPDLTDESRSRLRAAFTEVGGGDNEDATLRKEFLGPVLIAAGIMRKDSSTDSIISRRYHGSDQFSFQDLLQLARSVHAPTYYFGNRLRRCVNRGEINEVCELIVRGCNPNCADGEGLTPLHYASEFGKVEIMQSIFEKASDILDKDSKDKYGWTPLFTAVHHGNHNCVKFLIRNGCKVNMVNTQGEPPTAKVFIFNGSVVRKKCPSHCM
jgi:ankyrin repeat protein